MIKKCNKVINEKIDGVKDSLDQKIDGVEDRLDRKIDSVKDSLDRKIDGFKDSLDRKIDSVKDDLGRRIDGVAADLKAHRADTEVHKKVYKVNEPWDSPQQAAKIAEVPFCHGEPVEPSG